MVRVISGASFLTSAERSSAFSVVMAPTRSPSPLAAMPEYFASMPRRLISLAGRNTPAFIISISAVPPAIGRTVGSSGSSSFTASASLVGSASSNGVMLHSAAACAKRSRSRLTNTFSRSLALDRITGWPMLPSLPASAASTE